MPANVASGSPQGGPLLGGTGLASGDNVGLGGGPFSSAAAASTAQPPVVTEGTAPTPTTLMSATSIASSFFRRGPFGGSGSTGAAAAATGGPSTGALIPEGDLLLPMTTPTDTIAMKPLTLAAPPKKVSSYPKPGVGGAILGESPAAAATANNFNAGIFGGEAALTPKTTTGLLGTDVVTTAQNPIEVVTDDVTANDGTPSFSKSNRSAKTTGGGGTTRSRKGSRAPPPPSTAKVPPTSEVSAGAAGASTRPVKSKSAASKGHHQVSAGVNSKDPVHRPCQAHSFHTDAAEVQKMEKELLTLLAEFNSGKLRAFGHGCSMEQMEGIRDQQESLAKLHFDLGVRQDLSAPLSEEGIRGADDNMDRLMTHLERLSTAIGKLDPASMNTDSSNEESSSTENNLHPGATSPMTNGGGAGGSSDAER